jgi:hypothetical protein
VFGDIVSSHSPERNFNLSLYFEEYEHYWCVARPIRSIHQLSSHRSSTVGVLGPHGIASLVVQTNDSSVDIPFKEAGYLLAFNPVSIACLSGLRCLVELRVGNERNILPTAPHQTLPLFHTLRVLEAYNIHQSFFAGQTFHKLERCRILLSQEGQYVPPGLPVEMPVCTRLDVEDLILLSTFRLLQICELGVCFGHPESNLVWRKYIAMNANLSGLTLLYVHHWGVSTDLVPILGSLPVLITLSIGNGQDLDMIFFRAFIPLDENRTSGLTKHSSCEVHIPRMLCPMLKNLFIEGVDPREEPGLLVLKDVATLRAMGGSPLKRFTFSQFWPGHGRRFELIKRDRSFGMRKFALPMGTRPLELFI